MIKKIIAGFIFIGISACPLACVNDPTLDESTGVNTASASDTETFVDVTTETDTATETVN